MKLSSYGCGYVVEAFCAPPDQRFQCTPEKTVSAPCTPQPDGKFAIEPFVYEDRYGACRQVAAMTCDRLHCDVPEGTVVSCPASARAP
jgi:hypothetical protein